ncbi:hypothetical protein ScPMuIL_008545 [Solemya velum]
MDVDAAVKVCGQSVEIPPGTSARVTSAGKAPGGYCGLLFYTMNNETHKCDQICVLLNKTRANVCTAKVVFSGIHFGSTDRTVNRELSCWEQPKEPVCLNSRIMRMEIIEKHHYAFHWSKRSYSFEGTVYPGCHELAPGETFDIDVSEKINEESEKERRTYIYGIIVALCLACVFLIVLFIMYCHYKATGTSNKRDIAMPRIRKTLTFSGMRNKLSFSRLNSSSSGKSPKSPTKKKDNFKFEEEKPESEPLVATGAVVAATVAAAALEDQLEGDLTKQEVREKDADQPEIEKEQQAANDDPQPQAESFEDPASTVVEIEPSLTD